MSAELSTCVCGVHVRRHVATSYTLTDHLSRTSVTLCSLGCIIQWARQILERDAARAASVAAEDRRA